MKEITWEELELILSEPVQKLPPCAWLEKLKATGDAGLDDVELSDIATEPPEVGGSVFESVDALIRGIERPVSDRVRRAALAALRGYWLPLLRDEAREL